MSYQARLRSLFGTDQRDVTLAKIGVLVSALLFGLQFVAHEPLIVMIPLATGTGSALYLTTHNRRIRDVELPTLPAFVAGYVPSLVVGGLAAFVLLVWAAGGRTGPAYVVAALVGSAVLGQILLIDDDRLAPGLLLFQVFLVALVVRLSGLFTTPGYVGVDSWTHMPVLVQGIVESGSLAAIADVKYFMAPVYHLYVSVGTLVLGSPRTALYLTLGLIVPLSALLVYGTARTFVPVRWALFATALYAFADQFIRWGMTIIPNSLALVFFLAVLYGVTRLLTGPATRRTVALVFVFSMAIVFTHQLTTAILLAFLGVAAVVGAWRDLTGDRAGWVGGSTLALVGTLLVTVVVTLVSWANTPFGGEFIFLWRMLDVLLATVIEQAGFLNLASSGSTAVAATEPTLLDRLVPYVELGGFAILLCLAVVGGLVMFRWERPAGATSAYHLTATAMFVIIFGLSIFGVRVFLPGRWMAFLYAFLVIMGAIGLHYLFQTASRGTIVALALVLCLAYPATMVVGDKATEDAPYFENQQARFSYTNSELAAVDTIGAIHPPSVDERLSADHPYQSVFRRTQGYTTGILAIDESGPVTSGPTVFRDYQTSGSAKFRQPGDPRGVANARSVAAANVCPPVRNVVYSNGDVRLCTQSPVLLGGGA